MFTRQSLHKEIDELSAEQLPEVYALVHKLNEERKIQKIRDKIMSFAGAFSDISKDDFEDIAQHIAGIRAGLFK